MPSYVAVMPFVYKPYRDAFMESNQLDVFEVNNTVNNIGIMRAHNLGVDEMRRTDADWLIVVSAAIRFGKKGGLDFLEALDKNPDANAVEAEGVFGWHLIAFHRKTIEAAGKWDANFSPYGFCDIDMSVRIQKAFGSDLPKWEKVPVDVKDTGMAHSIKLANVKADASPRLLYFVEKWGRHPGAYKLGEYDRPFNNPDNPIGYWPEYEGSMWDD